MAPGEASDAQKANEIEHLNFFDNQWSQSPNDEGRDSSVEDGSEPSSSDVAGTHTDTAQMHQEDWGSATHFDNDDVQTPVLRMSDRKSKMPVRFNDYVLSAKVKYGIEKYVNYGELSSGVTVKTGEESAGDKDVQLEEGC
ncbi:reverse transcriptase, RNA-dependent DNA polymerase, Gag-polypeptide of LTR copia-type [Artemisia annua]|uniref:Reverse transcriptase, RNA-dependent DNA polymerase, Gag-polypeptide of LTR copia-type n=1 Tax=Artemisia annua TaxID=35608 RepID=A0A2U1PAH0_ARTAN|nr:reverse transcriptase, RNA-dependent DNA polymerase, Gag-polypeptide of LTR copia-type [Artemisia annua]